MTPTQLPLFPELLAPPRFAVVGPCVEWQGTLTRAGYGQGPRGLAHRAAYAAVFGEIPDELTLDHLCRNRRCVNPYHLEPVTHQENTIRSDSPSGRNARKTSCKYGHPFTPANTIMRRQHRPPHNPMRVCRTCTTRYARARSARRAAAAGRELGLPNALKQTCKAGHPFTHERDKLGRRICRPCVRTWQRTRRERKAAAQGRTLGLPNALRTTCKLGHPYDRIPAKGSRRCRRCTNAARNAARAANRERHNAERRARRAANLDREREYHREYYRANRERLNARRSELRANGTGPGT